MFFANRQLFFFITSWFFTILFFFYLDVNELSLGHVLYEQITGKDAPACFFINRLSDAPACYFILLEKTSGRAQTTQTTPTTPTTQTTQTTPTTPTTPVKAQRQHF
jgi:hypothetical protein